MRRLWISVLFISALLTSTHVIAADREILDAGKIVSAIRFLEDQPLDKRAPATRAALLQWEGSSEDTVDVVCPGVFAPLPDGAIQHNGELLAQFIFGSAAHQLVVPEDKGKLMAGQLAGMISMLKAYRAFVAAEEKARIPRFDALLHAQADGSLAGTLEPLVIENCLPKDAGKSRFPWTIGMSKAQVSAVKAHGPYRSFKNGDLETYNAVFDGHFQNFQFFFRDDKLWRISVYVFEGTDLTTAIQGWGDMYESMRRMFGGIQTPVNTAPVDGDVASMKAFKTRAQTLVEQSGRAQLAPLEQPLDADVFASFSQSVVHGMTFYDIALRFDAPHKLSTTAQSERVK